MANGASSTAQYFAFVWDCNKVHGERSHFFKFQHMEFKLQFYNHWNTVSDYRLYLCNNEDPSEPFDFSVYLIIGEDSVYHYTATVRKKVDDIVWQSTRGDLRKTVPDFENKPFRFVIVLHGSGKKEHKTVQTPVHLDTSFEIQSLSEDLSKLLDDDDSSKDVQLVCRDRTFSAHRNLLRVRSDVFKAMLGSDMTEGKTGIVKIEDADPEILQKFLEYLYGGKLGELTLDEAVELYKLADKYAVGPLKKQCVSYFVDSLAQDNACSILSLADYHSDEDLKEIATSYILEHEIPLQDGRSDWSNFSVGHPLLAVEVMTRLCKSLASSKLCPAK